MGGGPLCEYPQEFLHNGIYLPVLLDPEQCSRDPIVLAYTAGHFSAVVAMAAGAQPNPVSEVCQSARRHRCVVVVRLVPVGSWAS